MTTSQDYIHEIVLEKLSSRLALTDRTDFGDLHRRTYCFDQGVSRIAAVSHPLTETSAKSAFQPDPELPRHRQRHNPEEAKEFA